MSEPKKNTSIKATIKDGWNGLDGTTKIAIIIVVIILVIVLYGKVKTAIDENRLSKFNQKSSIDGGTVRDPRPLIDDIYKKLAGTNLYVYPEVINKLSNLSDSELQIAVDYWDGEYRTTTGMSLYEFINGEWDMGHYDPALEKLERKGYLYLG